MLLEVGADASATTIEGKFTLLHLAVIQEQETTTGLLVDLSDVDLKCKDDFDRSPLSYAAEMVVDAVVQLLLEKGVNATAENGNGSTALHFAALEGHELTTKLLLENGADVARTDKIGFNVLHLAASRVA
jgi:ankyrin repeat protein